MTYPRTAYVLLWFPKASETFIFREVANLTEMGLPLVVYTLYGHSLKGLSPEMRAFPLKIYRLGIPYLKRVIADLAFWLRRNHRKVIKLSRTMFLASPYSLEKTGENIWALLCSFYLARVFEARGIEHIHAPWASGPATAAWAVSQLTDIPFSFTARAWDIYPPDGILTEKIKGASFIRSETLYNIKYLNEYCGDCAEKIHLTYNGVPLKTRKEAPVAMTPPYRFLALGRFVGKKGYVHLLRACRILKDAGLDFRLTLVGDGPLEKQLKTLSHKLGLSGHISFPGFLSHDRVSECFYSSDIFLMPSVLHPSGDRDGIPTVIMESLLHRVPVIATNVSGIPEVIEDGVTGILIREKDPVAISRAVLRVLAGRKEAIAMAERGRARVLKQFNPETNHRKILELYQEYKQKWH